MLSIYKINHTLDLLEIYQWDQCLVICAKKAGFDVFCYNNYIGLIRENSYACLSL